MLTLDQEYAKYAGQSVLVPGASATDRGQCVQWADYVLHDVYGQPYVWANAIDWWNQFDSWPQLKNNFHKVADGTIKKGDFIIWNQKVGSVYGHIDVAMADGNINSFTASDTNWAGNLTVHKVAHIGQAGYIIGVLRHNSVTPTAQGEKPVTDDEKLTSAPVLDVAYYRNRYPDLARNGVNTDDKARAHWLSSGIKEGRQSSRVFSVAEYIENYSDLQRVFGAKNDLRGAALHWFNSGISEGRHGTKAAAEVASSGYSTYSGAQLYVKD